MSSDIPIRPLALPGIYSPEEVLRIIEKSLDVYQEHSLQGERFGEILERMGKEPMETLRPEERSS